MKLIVGLGNPGDKYRYTRHNLGFIFVDKFREEGGFSEWKYESKFQADICSGTLNGEKTLLVKPQTFMNLSGESLQKICNFYKLGAEDFTVIYDDKDMDFGKVRTREKGSAGGHNGIKSIIKHFGENWNRVKVGVGKTPENYETSDWVLSKFSEEELIDIDNEIYKKISEEVKKKITMTKKLYLIGIGGIGVSALARYYLSQNWKVYGSDSSDSALITSLKEEGCDIIIGADASRLDTSFDLVIHSEAIPEQQEELEKAREGGIKTLKYNEALGKVVNNYKLIAVAGTHGKSTTTSMISQILKNSHESFGAIVGTLLKEFDGKNFFSRGEKNYFVIEACEYKEHFLEYRPTVGVITNIEYDHADYFKTPESYLDAYKKFIEAIIPNGFVILDENDENSKKLIGLRNDIHYILVSKNSFTLSIGEQQQTLEFPEIIVHIPGEHILYDTKLAYIVGHMIGIDNKTILETLEDYSGVWRRMERIGLTENRNILMSDYGHHPTEIQVTLKALKEGYPDKNIYTIFQPHQYSRTIELLDEFKDCFENTDTLIIPDIYESRDSEEDKKKMTPEKFVDEINHLNVIHGNGMEHTLKLIEEYDSVNPESSIILLLGAGNVDNLRYKIKTEL